MTLLSGLAGWPEPSRAAPKASDLVSVELLPEPAGIASGQPFTVAIRLRMAEHWHTYWRNPGDSGLATEIAWTLPPGFTAGPIQWPTPSRIPIGPLVNYGYEDEATLLVAITPPADLAAGREAALKARVNYLVCERECIPGEAQVSATLRTVTPGEPTRPEPTSAYVFTEARAKLPTPFPGDARLVPKDGELVLHWSGVGSGDVTSAYFFPADETAIDHAARQALSRDASGWALALKRSPLSTGPAPGELPGVLVVEGAGSFTIGSPDRTPGRAGTTLVPERAAEPAPSVWLAVLFAFLGGLVLNLMPCVFPVLSIKVLHLVGHSGLDRRAVRWAGLSYTAGVVASFLALAGLLLALRAGGQEIGWGFQLQSPAFVVALIFLLAVVGLSLSGFAEFGAGIAGRAGAAATGSGAGSSFLTGVLAAVVATPCTAPFMGVAIGYAVTAPVGTALAVFAALGLGLAAPFLVLALRPSWLAILPRPGAWMETLKQALAFPVYATVAWLLFVLAQQVGEQALLSTLLGLVLLAFALWTWRRASEGEGMGRRVGQAASLLACLALVALGVLAWQDRGRAGAAIAGAANGEGQFSEARLDGLRAEGRPVFINMTAAWCITCLVNERTVLSGDAIRTAFVDRDVVYLKGDWTNQNPEITRLLERHGRNGVPLYVLYPPGGEPVVLPQILTRSAVLDALSQVPLSASAASSRRADASEK